MCIIVTFISIENVSYIPYGLTPNILLCIYRLCIVLVHGLAVHPM